MKWRLVTAVLVAAMLLCAAGSVAADQQYACTDQSCSFTVPDSYSVASNDPAQIIFQDAASGGAFSVAATDGSAFNSLDDAVNSIGASAASSDSYQAGPSNGQNITLGGNPATIVEYMAKNSSGTMVETANFITLYHGKLYQLIFVTAPENEDAFVSGAQGVFSSWQFT